MAGQVPQEWKGMDYFFTESVYGQHFVRQWRRGSRGGRRHGGLAVSPAIFPLLDSMSISRFGIKCAMHDGLVSHAKLFSRLLYRVISLIGFLARCSLTICSATLKVQITHLNKGRMIIITLMTLMILMALTQLLPASDPTLTRL